MNPTSHRLGGLIAAAITAAALLSSVPVIAAGEWIVPWAQLEREMTRVGEETCTGIADRLASVSAE
ncbi:MAG: hypothetical protein OEW19_12405, partial [Acidobacteriota bacterium]|nr:hypothetical protein [Acidobacteriota bacterium]